MGHVFNILGCKFSNDGSAGRMYPKVELKLQINTVSLVIEKFSSSQINASMHTVVFYVCNLRAEKMYLQNAKICAISNELYGPIPTMLKAFKTVEIPEYGQAEIPTGISCIFSTGNKDKKFAETIEQLPLLYVKKYILPSAISDLFDVYFDDDLGVYIARHRFTVLEVNYNNGNVLVKNFHNRPITIHEGMGLCSLENVKTKSKLGFMGRAFVL